MENIQEQIVSISKASAYDAIKDDYSRLKRLESEFYMAICVAYNAGKRNMLDCVKAADPDLPFIASDTYFKTTFPEFKTNVP